MAQPNCKKGKINMHDFASICVDYDENHAPYLEFEGTRYAVSISHDGEYAIACVIVE